MNGFIKGAQLIKCYLIVLFIGLQVTYAETITLCSDPWPPYTGVSGSNKSGYIIEVVERIFEKYSIDIKYVNHSWGRCIEEVRKGRITALAGADVLEVPGFIFPKRTIGVTAPAFFVRKGFNWRYSGVASLQKIVLGYIADYTYEQKIDAYIRRADPNRVTEIKGENALRRLLTLLKLKRIDAFIENEVVVKNSLIQEGLKSTDYQIAGAPDNGVRLFISLSPVVKKSCEYSRLFDIGINELRASGELSAILNKYDILDWEKSQNKLPLHFGRAQCPLNQTKGDF